MAAEYNAYLIKFTGTPEIEFNDTSGSIFWAKIDTILDSVPISIRENIEEIIMSDDAVDTADGKFRPTSIVLTGKLWHTASAKLAYDGCLILRALCYGITVPGDLRIYWKEGGSSLIGKVDHCSSFNINPSNGMRTVEFEIVFTVLEAGI